MSQNPPFLPPDDDAPAADLHAPVAGSEVPYLRMASDSVEPAQLHSYWQDHLCKMVINSDCKAKPGHDLFFQMNHWLEQVVPSPSDAARVNARGFLLDRARRCERRRDHIPNVVAVNFYASGDLMGAVDAINGVRSPAR